MGLALTGVFVGGALGRAICGRLGERLGVTRAVILTEVGTAAAILAAIGLPLWPALPVLPLLGLLLNGTSSVLYGTVPELAPGGRVDQAFAVYTCTLGRSALAAPLVDGRLGDLAGPRWAAVAAAATALAVVPLMLALMTGRSRPNGRHGIVSPPEARRMQILGNVEHLATWRLSLSRRSPPSLAASPG